MWFTVFLLGNGTFLMMVSMHTFSRHTATLCGGIGVIRGDCLGALPGMVEITGTTHIGAIHHGIIHPGIIHIGIALIGIRHTHRIRTMVG